MVFLIHQALDRAAFQLPEQEALCFNQHSLSYGELASKTSTLASLLQAQGVKPRDRVGIFMNKGLESIIALYAILKAGACYVPIDPSSTVERVAFIVSDCDIKVLFSQPNKTHIIEQICNLHITLACCIGVESILSSHISTFSWSDIESLPSAVQVETGIIEQDLAYIIYTSGSTGEPKGIMHTHYSGLAYIKWVVQYYGFKQDDRFSNHAPLHFDMSTLDYFAPLLVGATTVIVPEAVMKLPVSYAELLEKQAVSIFFTVPLALTQLLHYGAISKRDLSQLRWIIFGGESMPVKYLRELMLALPDCQFNNMYGPAESNGCTCYDVKSLSNDDASLIPIGKVFATMQSKVLDEQDQELTGVTEKGELVVRGPSLMQGYWGREDLNQKAFYTEQIITGVDDKYYRTGDIVEIDEQGNYLFIGRRDRQIKIRAYRVELDGIENCLLSHPQVQEAAVFARKDEQDNWIILANVILVSENSVSDAILTNFLLAKLPRYAVPKQISFSSSLPRISSGKINYLELMKQG